MPALSVRAIVNQLHDAGLSLSVTSSGGLAVTPSSHLTEDLRDIIRGSKALLVDWVAATTYPEPPTEPARWHDLEAAYNAHHVNCKTCIAAGRGKQYSLRCGTGAALWSMY